MGSREPWFWLVFFALLFSDGRQDAHENGFCYQVGTSVSSTFVYESPKSIFSTCCFDEMIESVARNSTIDDGFCFQGGTCASLHTNGSWGDCANTVGETAPLCHFGWISGSPSEPVSVSVTDRPPTRFKGYHGPALPLSFHWRTTSSSNRPPRFFPFFRLPTVWPSG